MIRESLKDHNNKTSSFRLVWVVTSLVVVFTWSYISLKNNALQSLSVGDAFAFLTLIGGKSAASYIENMKEKKDVRIVPD